MNKNISNEEKIRLFDKLTEKLSSVIDYLMEEDIASTYQSEGYELSEDEALSRADSELMNLFDDAGVYDEMEPIVQISHFA